MIRGVTTVLYLKLKPFLEQHHITETALADAITESFIDSGRSVSERYLRYIAGNTERITPDNPSRKPSLVMLGFVITGLRRLTHEPVAVNDVLEYVPEDGTSPITETEEAVEIAQESTDLVLARPKHDDDLDAIRKLVTARLTKRGHIELAALLSTADDPASNEQSVPWQTPKRKKNRWAVQGFGVLSLVVLSVTVYEFAVVRPRLFMLGGGVFSFRDRLQDTSSLPLPTLIGPEGQLDQLAPILRVEPVEDAVGYEFYVENLVSEDGVYTGPISNSSFTIPEGTLCPGTEYAWRVRVLGQDGWTSFSSPLEFTVTPEAMQTAQTNLQLLRIANIESRPEEPVMLAPLGTTHTMTPQLAVKPEPNVIGYGYYIRDLLTDKVVYNNNFATQPRVQLPQGLLNDGGIYQWNTRARNCHYWSEFTEAQVFTVTAQGNGQTSQTLSPNR